MYKQGLTREITIENCLNNSNSESLNLETTLQFNKKTKNFYHAEIKQNMFYVYTKEDLPLNKPLLVLLECHQFGIVSLIKYELLGIQRYIKIILSFIGFLLSLIFILLNFKFDRIQNTLIYKNKK